MAAKADHTSSIVILVSSNFGGSVFLIDANFRKVESLYESDKLVQKCFSASIQDFFINNWALMTFRKANWVIDS